MKVKDITPGLADYQIIQDLYQASFPKDQRMPFEQFQNLSQQAATDFLAFYKQDLFCGFAHIWHYQDYSVISYLAVEGSLRSHGYGSEILHEIEKLYPQQTIIVEIERPDAEAENLQERLQRQAFYLKNGYHYLHYYIEFEGLAYDLYSNSRKFDPNQYYQVYAQAFPKHSYKPIKDCREEEAQNED